MCSTGTKGGQLPTANKDGGGQLPTRKPGSADCCPPCFKECFDVNY